MGKKTKDETLDLFYFNSSEQQNKKKKMSQEVKRSKNNTKNQNRQKLDKKSIKQKTKRVEKDQKEETKEEKFNFDEEIIIGLRRIDNEEDKPKNKQNKNQLKQNKSKVKAKYKKEEAKKEGEFSNISQIGEKNRNNVRKKNNPIQKKNVQKKLTPEQELAKKKRKAVFRITKWLMLFTIVIGSVVYALLSPIFNVKKVEVIGNSKISSDEIVSLSGIGLEQNMFQYRKEDIIKRIKENAYIDTVKVSRRIPDTIQVVVAERKASFMMQFANAYAYISSQGYILEISNQKLDLPILVGFETQQENIQVGLRICTEDLEKLGDVLKIMEAATSNKLAQFITKINITDQNNYILTMQKKKKVVYLGDTSNLSTKMLWILSFNAQEKNTQGDIMLNMNLNDEKNKPYFREKI